MGSSTYYHQTYPALFRKWPYGGIIIQNMQNTVFCIPNCCADDVHYNDTTVLYTHTLVGCSSHLATRCLLLRLIFYKHRHSSSFCSSNNGSRCLWMDIDGVHFASLCFPHPNKHLSVRLLTSIIMINHPPSLWTEILEKMKCRGNTLHYLLHGCHHKHPMDGLRLVFPPAATAIVLMAVCQKFNELILDGSARSLLTLYMHV